MLGVVKKKKSADAGQVLVPWYDMSVFTDTGVYVHVCVLQREKKSTTQ
jgi:hypothetical protein